MIWVLTAPQGDVIRCSTIVNMRAESDVAQLLLIPMMLTGLLIFLMYFLWLPHYADVLKRTLEYFLMLVIDEDYQICLGLKYKQGNIC